MNCLLTDFRLSRSLLFHIFSSTLVCVACIAQWGGAPTVAHDVEVGQWPAVETGRLTDWSAQLPAGEGLREGIIGIAVV